MNRRELLSALGATAGAGVLAGCSNGGSNGDGGSDGGSDGGTSGGFEGSVQGPYTYNVNDELEVLWGRVTLETVPEWPTDGFYRGWVGTEANGPIGVMTALNGDRTIPRYKFEKKDYVGDRSITVDGSVDEVEKIEPGATLTFGLRDPGSEELYTLGTLSYEGNAPKKTPKYAP